MYTSKLRICRILIIAGIIWLSTVMTLFYYWELIMEHQLKVQRYSKNPTDDIEPAQKVNHHRDFLVQESTIRVEETKIITPDSTTRKRFTILTDKRRPRPLTTTSLQPITTAFVFTTLPPTTSTTLPPTTTTTSTTSPPSTTTTTSPSTTTTTSPSTTTSTQSTTTTTTIQETTTRKKRMYERVVTPVAPETLKLLQIPQNVGENGRGHTIDKPPAEIKKIIDNGWKRHEFNEFLSDIISVNRTVPDPRSEYCLQPGLYLENLPMTSVIIIFHNEAWSTLLRSVHSVINRSPPHLLKEVILVDDYSNMLHLKEALEDYMSDYPKVKIVRMEKRVGLIKARIAGTNAAAGPILTFLDSHVECASGWLEPLLDRIARDKTKVVCPVIDVIDDNSLTFSYQGSGSLQVGGFTWEMTFDWHMIPEREKLRKKDTSEPTQSPTMAGGLFSIDKEFFVKLGLYDDGFDIWGGENLELSFKTWMCGGTLEVIPCSHVGHIFRKKSPYKWRPGVDVVKINTVRLVDVWLDEYARLYYVRRGNDKGNFGDISSRLELRKNLNCKSFKWYLENVYPELPIPDNLGEGFIRNKGTEHPKCFDLSIQDDKFSSKPGIYDCHNLGGNQFFEYSKKFEITRKYRCLDYNYEKDDLYFISCHMNKGNQHWIYRTETSQFIHKSSSKCLSIKQEGNNYFAIMEKCDDKNEKQKWELQYVYEDKLAQMNVNKTATS